VPIAHPLRRLEYVGHLCALLRDKRKPMRVLEGIDILPKPKRVIRIVRVHAGARLARVFVHEVVLPPVDVLGGYNMRGLERERRAGETASFAPR